MTHSMPKAPKKSLTTTLIAMLFVWVSGIQTSTAFQDDNDFKLYKGEVMDSDSKKTIGLCQFDPLRALTSLPLPTLKGNSP